MRQEKSFPALARMARDVLAIPIASVGTEREFSSARDIVTYRRNNLTGETLRDIPIVIYCMQQLSKLTKTWKREISMR